MRECSRNRPMIERTRTLSVQPGTPARRQQKPRTIKSILTPARETSRHDLRFAVINRAANQMIFSVLERNDIDIAGIAKNLQDLSREHPIVSVKNARPRFDDKPSHVSRR